LWNLNRVLTVAATSDASPQQQGPEASAFLLFYGTHDNQRSKRRKNALHEEIERRHLDFVLVV